MRGFYHGDVVRSQVKEAESKAKHIKRVGPAVHKRIYESKIL